MRLLRSWPAEGERQAEGRPHVVDNIERLYISGYDYAPLAAVDDDVLLLEWDIAVGQEDIEHFAEHAAEDPDRVLAAPYKIYRESTAYRKHWPRADARWFHPLTNLHSTRQAYDPNVLALSHWETVVPEGSPTCDKFGFGMVYLPRALVQAFAATHPGHFNDTTFSAWHHSTVGRGSADGHPARICWDVRVIHLHFDIRRQPRPTLDVGTATGWPVAQGQRTEHV